jgi:hypothetical protein
MQYRQGDVLIEEVAEIPKGAVKVAPVNGRLVLAEGEATGHAHTIEADYGEMVEKDGVLYLVVKRDAPLSHQEHATVTLPKKKHVVTRQQQWSDALEPRPVLD